MLKIGITHYALSRLASLACFVLRSKNSWHHLFVWPKIWVATFVRLQFIYFNCSVLSREGKIPAECVVSYPNFQHFVSYTRGSLISDLLCLRKMLQWGGGWNWKIWKKDMLKVQPPPAIVHFSIPSAIPYSTLGWFFWHLVANRPLRSITQGP